MTQAGFQPVGGAPKVYKQLSLGEVLHLIPGDVVYGHSLVPTHLQAAEDVEQQVQVVIPAPTRYDSERVLCTAVGVLPARSWVPCPWLMLYHLTCSALASHARTAQRWGTPAAGSQT